MGRWFDEEDHRRLPAEEAHAWEAGTNQTLCALSPFRTRLARATHTARADVIPDGGGAADEAGRVGPRCLAGTGRTGGHAWTRIRQRPST